MRRATWQALEASPAFRRLYGAYRRLPDGVRAPVRWVATPRWQALTAIIQSASGRRVVAGPFRGMQLHLSPVSRRHLQGYILGSQELELRDVTERIVRRGYHTIINVGAADGYYAVGLAMRSPQSRVIAFEALSELHPLIRQSAMSNGVGDRIACRGLCSLGNLQDELAAAEKPALVFMDAEGAEMALLDPAGVPALRETDVFVETHDSFAPGCTDTLVERFSPTHAVERLEARPRQIADYPKDFLPLVPRLFPKLAVDLMDERRTGTQQWLYLTART